MKTEEQIRSKIKELQEKRDVEKELGLNIGHPKLADLHKGAVSRLNNTIFILEWVLEH